MNNEHICKTNENKRMNGKREEKKKITRTENVYYVIFKLV